MIVTPNIDVVGRGFNHIDGHYVRLNRVALKYPDFKKNVDVMSECSIL
jgi:hypothetical protein